mmetsp:Transcript_28160/g.38720  ORF Transcript_28160/g.38720 Transcript_28160/m.38720 type:complete len:234 (-) Transcript_28160:504-1205(-)
MILSLVLHPSPIEELPRQLCCFLKRLERLSLPLSLETYLLWLWTRNSYLQALQVEILFCQHYRHLHTHLLPIVGSPKEPFPLHLLHLPWGELQLNCFVHPVFYCHLEMKGIPVQHPPQLLKKIVAAFHSYSTVGMNLVLGVLSLLWEGALKYQKIWQAKAAMERLQEFQISSSPDLGSQFSSSWRLHRISYDHLHMHAHVPSVPLRNFSSPSLLGVSANWLFHLWQEFRLRSQ